MDEARSRFSEGEKKFRREFADPDVYCERYIRLREIFYMETDTSTMEWAFYEFDDLVEGMIDVFLCRRGMSLYADVKEFVKSYTVIKKQVDRIKEELFCLADTPLSKGRYTRFLVKAMLTDRNIAAGLDKIDALPEFADKAIVAADGISNGSIKDILTGLSEYLDRHPVLDIEVNVLRALTAEIMESMLQI